MRNVVLTLLFAPLVANFAQGAMREQPSPDAGDPTQEFHELDEIGGEREAQDPHGDLIFSAVATPSQPLLAMKTY